MARIRRPFRVYKLGRGWVLEQQIHPHYIFMGFRSPTDAINFAQRNWPWWP